MKDEKLIKNTCKNLEELSHDNFNEATISLIEGNLKRSSRYLQKSLWGMSSEYKEELMTKFIEYYNIYKNKYFNKF